jgi:hypothetical protein
MHINHYLSPDGRQRHIGDLMLDLPGFQKGDDLPSGYLRVYEQDFPTEIADDGMIWLPGALEDIEVDGEVAKIIPYVQIVEPEWEVPEGRPIPEGPETKPEEEA